MSEIKKSVNSKYSSDILKTYGIQYRKVNDLLNSLRISINFQREEYTGKTPITIFYCSKDGVKFTLEVSGYGIKIKDNNW